MHPQDTSFLVNGFKPTIALDDPGVVQARQQAARLNQQQLQAGSLAIQQTQTDLNDQQIFSGAMRDAGGDPQKAFMLAAQRGASGKGLMGMQQMLLKNRETQSTIGKNDADAASANMAAKAKQNEMVEGAATSLLNLPPSQRAASYPAAMQQIAKDMGVDPASLPQNYEAFGASMNLPPDQALLQFRDQHANNTEQLATQKAALDKTAADQKLAVDAAEEARKAALAPSLLTKATNDAATSTPNAAGLTTEQQTSADQAAATLAQKKIADAQTAKSEGQRNAIAAGELSINQKKLILMTGGPAPLGADGKPLSGEAYLSTLAPGRAAQIRMYANGQTGNSSLPRGDAKQAFMDQVGLYSPGFTDQIAQTRKDFSSAGASGGNIQSLSTGVVHLDQLGEAAKAMGNNTFRPGNQVVNDMVTMFGGAAPTNFEGLKAAVASEMATALKGNATDPEIAAASKTISETSSPAQLTGIIDTNLHTLGAKLNTKDEQYHKAVPGDPGYNPVLPTAQKVFEKHGFQPIQRLATQAPSLPAAAKSQLKEGSDTTFGNGQVWTLKNGIETRVK